MCILAFSVDPAACCSTHLIDGDGTFDATGLDKFMKEVNLNECGLSYAVVSIMGPQSSGMDISISNHKTHITHNPFSVDASSI